VEGGAEPTHLHIGELERRLREAMRGSDLEELDAILADDLIFADHLGMAVDFTAPGWTFLSRGSFRALARSDETLQVLTRNKL
jgi:hypothetical protein